MMRVPALLLTLASLAACSKSADPADCKRFKTGHFRFVAHQSGMAYSWLIDRTDSIQTETDEVTGDVSKLSVKWVDDCHYQLKLMSSTRPFPDSIQQIRKTVALQTEITEATSHYYIFSSFRDKSELVLTDTMWVR
jgi:hypothetical protein